MRKLFAAFAILAAATAYSTVRADDARQYTIQEHDTLWDISNSEFSDPFLWPKLWNVNPEIDNPDLIYPGSSIRIPSREELMKMGLPVEKPRPVFQKKRKVQRVKPVEVARKKVFINYLVNPDAYISSGWIAADFKPLGTVHSAPMERTIAGKGETVYLKIPYLSVDSPEPRQGRFFTARDVKLVKHPVTGAKIGHHIRITGVVETAGMEGSLVKANVIESYEDVQVGEMLLPFTEMKPPLVPDTPRTPDIKGYVVESHMSTLINGEGDIVFLDMGEGDGLQVGDIFTVFSDPPAPRPLARLQVFALQPETSSAVIVQGTDEVSIGDGWGPVK